MGLEHALRSHNAKTPVAMDCHELQNPLIYAELVTGGCPPLLRGAPWVVSAMVSNGIVNHRRGPPCRTAYAVMRGDLVRKLARGVEPPPAAQQEERILLHLATGGLHMERLSSLGTTRARPQALVESFPNGRGLRVIPLPAHICTGRHPKVLRRSPAVSQC